MYLTIDEAAEQLKMKPSTVRRKIRQGLIPARRIGGFNTPWRIDPIELRAVMNGLEKSRRDGEFAELLGVTTSSEAVQYAELERRCIKLARALNDSRPIFTILRDQFGVSKLADLHPRDYAPFRGKLMRLSRGLTGRR